MEGTLFIVGGGLNRSADEVFSALIERAGGPQSRFAFVVSASGEGPDETFRSYVEDFGKLGVPADHCVLVPLYAEHVRDERGYNAFTGDADGLCELLEGVTGVWFTGGDQYFTAGCFLRKDGSDTRLLAKLREIYANGGEYEGHSLYCFGGDRTSNGISRPTGAKLRKNEIIQLNIGARVGGYSSSIGLPVWFGKLPKEQLALVEFGLRAHKYTFELIKAGVEASDIARKYTQWGCDQGWGDYMLYGPVHGLGIMETESPWIETTSKYKLQENMTYQIDTFFTGDGYGLRWERGCIVTKDGCELMSKKFMSMDCCKLD